MDLIEQLARKAGFTVQPSSIVMWGGDCKDGLRAFAALVAEHVASMSPAAWVAERDGAPIVMDHETFVAWRDTPGAPRMPGAPLPSSYRPLVDTAAICDQFNDPTAGK